MSKSKSADFHAKPRSKVELPFKEARRILKVDSAPEDPVVSRAEQLAIDRERWAKKRNDRIFVLVPDGTCPSCRHFFGNGVAQNRQWVLFPPQSMRWMPSGFRAMSNGTDAIICLSCWRRNAMQPVRDSAKLILDARKQQKQERHKLAAAIRDEEVDCSDCKRPTRRGALGNVTLSLCRACCQRRRRAAKRDA